MQTNLNQQPQQPKKFNCPVPKALLPFLDKMDIHYKKTGEPCMLSNMENVEIELKSDFDLTGIIYAAWEHGFDDHYQAVKSVYHRQTSAA
jgi:hypothetical protein